MKNTSNLLSLDTFDFCGRTAYCARFGANTIGLAAGTQAEAFDEINERHDELLGKFGAHHEGMLSNVARTKHRKSPSA